VLLCPKRSVRQMVAGVLKKAIGLGRLFGLHISAKPQHSQIDESA